MRDELGRQPVPVAGPAPITGRPANPLSMMPISRSMTTLRQV